MRLNAKTISVLCSCAMLFSAAQTSLAGHKDIVDTAVAAGSFKTLATALTKAELIDALKGKGPFTVFAPTDAAFAKLPKKTLNSLLKPENRDQLVSILTYHVVPGRVSAAEVVKLSSARTLNGQQAAISIKDGNVMVDSANVIKTDITCSNGIIHVIDSVILPSSNDIVETAIEAGQFKTLAAALKAGGLVGALRGEGPFTVFAPTDAAFAKLPHGTLDSLLKPENKGTLVSILKYHVVKGRVFADDALKAAKATTLQGSGVKIRVSDGKFKVNDSVIAMADIDASNGVIHVIDTVLMPPQQEARANPAQELIQLAISRGAPLFNHGQKGACTAIYEVTARSLMEMSSPRLASADRKRLQRALRQISRTHDEGERAWILRRALDDTYESLNSMDSQARMTNAGGAGNSRTSSHSGCR